VRPMSPYVGLEPAMWRNLLALATIFHATRTKLCEFCIHIDENRVVQKVMLDLELHAQVCAAQNLDDDETVNRVISGWKGQLDNVLGLQLETDIADFLTELRTLMCRDRVSDPFRKIFDGVAKLASAVYGENWRLPTLEVAHLGRHPRESSNDAYAVTAATPWPPDEASAEVELRIYCDRFRPAAFAAVPMLLTHECVCHVPARQDRAANDSAFAEGLLDWTAYVYYENWVVKLDRELAPAARQHADLLRRVLTQADGPEGRARRLGHLAAEYLQAWFEDSCEQPPAEAKKTVARLAVQLNIVDRPLSHKDHFVSLVSWPMRPVVANALSKWEYDEVSAEVLLDTATGLPLP